MLPKEIECRDALPQTPIGKPSKKDLVTEELARRETAAGRSTGS
jgi:non-ribosomal peptide synthetase component E (peptide arylation enzyme)